VNVNALFAQAGRRGDCYCLKASVPPVTDPAVPAGFDPARLPAQKGARRRHPGPRLDHHDGGVECEDPVPADPSTPTTGTARRSGRDLWLTLREDGATEAGNDAVLDPGHPDAAEYITRMYTSVVENYPVDGVQLDRVRYPDDPSTLPVWGYNPTALERFASETGRADRPAPTDPEWMRWRRDQVTRLVRRIYLAVKAIRPEVWVSAATITYGDGPASRAEFERSRTYSQVLQDWAGWMEEGILDLNIPMNYKRDAVPSQARAFDRWNRFALAHRARVRSPRGRPST
jgi:uncharacterized lipoprotein YddW (UPF0748 family)